MSRLAAVLLLVGAVAKQVNLGLVLYRCFAPGAASSDGSLPAEAGLDATAASLPAGTPEVSDDSCSSRESCGYTGEVVGCQPTTNVSASDAWRSMGSPEQQARDAALHQFVRDQVPEALEHIGSKVCVDPST